jgi:leader peptidase (prepilin peptidase)/N-methyltransferase
MRIGIAALVVAWLAVLSCYDIREGRLPNALTLPGAGVILLAGAVAGRGAPALAGAAALTGVYLLVHLIAPAALAAPLLTALCAVSMRATGLFGGAGGAGTVPHGPSMCVATAAATGLALLG